MTHPPARKECVFCTIIHEYAPVTDFRYHGSFVYSFVPLNPVTPGHRLFIPRKHVPTAAHAPELVADCMRSAATHGSAIHEQFNLIVNNGPHASQTVPHLHIHYVPRRENDGLHLPWTGQQA